MKQHRVIVACLWALSVFTTALPAQSFIDAESTFDGKQFERTTPRPKPTSAIKSLPSLVSAARLAEDSAAGGWDAAAQKINGLGYRALVGEELRFEIVEHPSLHSTSSAAITSLGGTVVYTVRDRIEGRIHLSQLEALLELLPEGAFLEPSGHGQVSLDTEGQGPTIMRDGPYRDLGYDGTGITIAVIDVGYQNLNNSIMTEDSPDNATNVNYSALAFQAPQDGNHGRFVMETIYDHAPGADYVIYKVDNQTQAAFAIDDAASRGVHIISMSLGWFPQWDDGVNTISQSADDAAAQGILVFNSVGNSAQQHWEGFFIDPDNDGFLSWDGGIDEVLQCTVQPGDTASFRLSFNRDNGNHNYDLYVYNFDGTVELDSSDNPGESFEAVSVPNNTNAPMILQLVVERVAGPGTVLEIYAGRDTIMNEHIVTGSSPLSPSDASHPSVISVGAVEQVAYGSAKQTSGIQASYSSQGPTNGLQLVPDISAPTSTSGSFFGSFIGTSCSCPHAAGLTAVLWSTNPAAQANQVRSLMYEYAEDKDWGVVGSDYIFGRGGVNLPEYADCNFDGNPDAFDIASGASSDNNDNGVPDECDPNGFLFGVDSPELPTPANLVFFATLDPDALPTAPNPGVTGVDMVFGFDHTVMQIDSVEPAPALIDLLGGTPAELTWIVVDGALGVTCEFGSDPATGAPADFTFDGATDMLKITGSVIPGSNGGSTGAPTGPPVITFGLENQPAALILPAIQKVRAVDAAGVPYELTPVIISSVVSLPTVELPRHAYEITAGPGVTSSAADEIATSMQVEIEPTAPVTPFSLVWSGRELFDNGDTTDALNAAVSVDPSILTVLGATASDEVNALSPDLFLVTIGTDGVSIGCTWSTTGTAGATVPLGLSGLPLATIDLETTATALPMGASSVDTTIAFATPPSLPTAENRVAGPGYDETPLAIDGTLTLVSLAPPADEFRRGDVDGSGSADIGDAINILNHLFAGGPDPQCGDAADVNDDGALNIADSVALLGYLFTSATAPPAPGPIDCGVDPTPDSFDCSAGSGC